MCTLSPLCPINYNKQQANTPASSEPFLLFMLVLRRASMCLSPRVVPPPQGRTFSQSEISASVICHPPMLPQPFSEPFQPFSEPFQHELLSGTKGIFSSSAVIWMHLQTHVRLKMSHFVPPHPSPEEDSYLVYSSKGTQPSDDLASVGCVVDPKQRPHNIHNSKEPHHPILHGREGRHMGTVPVDAPVFRYTRFSHMSYRQKREPFNSSPPHYLWLCQAVFGWQLCYVIFPVET